MMILMRNEQNLCHSVRYSRTFFSTEINKLPKLKLNEKLLAPFFMHASNQLELTVCMRQQFINLQGQRGRHLICTGPISPV